MQKHPVVIISRHLLLVEAIRHVIEREDIGPVIHVQRLEEALDIIGEEKPAAIITEIEEDISCEEMAAQVLAHHEEDCQVICVSLANSDITVFSRHRIPRATQTELVHVLQNSVAAALESLSTS